MSQTLVNSAHRPNNKRALDGAACLLPNAVANDWLKTILSSSELDTVTQNVLGGELQAARGEEVSHSHVVGVRTPTTVRDCKSHKSLHTAYNGLHMSSRLPRQLLWSKSPLLPRPSSYCWTCARLNVHPNSC